MKSRLTEATAQNVLVFCSVFAREGQGGLMRDSRELALTMDDWSRIMIALLVHGQSRSIELAGELASRIWYCERLERARGSGAEAGARSEGPNRAEARPPMTPRPH